MAVPELNKDQALYAFWSGFTWPAYDENTVPDDAAIPRITYNTAKGSIDTPVSLSASLLDRSTSWKSVSDKAEEIAKAINEQNPPSVKIDTGRMFITAGNPIAQRLPDDTDPMVRRILMNIQVEFFTNY